MSAMLTVLAMLTKLAKLIHRRAVGAVIVTGCLVAAWFATAPIATAVPDDPLAGAVIMLDPGHQLGNGNPEFADQMAQQKFNGFIWKSCNTTGAATNAGLPEATFTWEVATRLKRLLEKRGARVLMTRSENSRDAWGPCVWDRAGAANKAKADVLLSIHADGAKATDRGFFAIAPARLPGWTDDIVKPSRRLANAMITGMADAGAKRSTYVKDQLFVWKNQSTLNFSDVPAVIMEVGNMRNRKDARLMSTPNGQDAYARWLLAGLERYFAQG